MDLDNIKKKWQETEIKPSITEDKIKKMISNEGRSAFSSLLRYEKLGIIGLILCVPLGYFVFERHLLVSVFFVATCVIALLWQIFKYRKLKNCNISEMSITEIAVQFYWYRKAIFREFYIGLIWIIFFFIFFGYFELLYDSVDFYKRLTILIICLIIGIFLANIIYRRLYWKNIKKLEESIKELDEFEDNEEKDNEIKITLK